MALEDLSLDRLSAAGLWNVLDADTRAIAARAVYEDPEDDRTAPAEADVAIAKTLRFRLVAVRRLPLQKRTDYLARVVRPDDSLASSLLRALHLTHRRPLLSAFLDALDIPHENGVIDSGYDIDEHSPDSAQLFAALAALDKQFPRGEIDLYGLTLLAIDPVSWSALTEVLDSRRRESA